MNGKDNFHGAFVSSQVYELCVLETKPGKAVSIIECDMNVSMFT